MGAFADNHEMDINVFSFEQKSDVWQDVVPFLFKENTPENCNVQRQLRFLGWSQDVPSERVQQCLNVFIDESCDEALLVGRVYNPVIDFFINPLGEKVA